MAASDVAATQRIDWGEIGCTASDHGDAKKYCPFQLEAVCSQPGMPQASYTGRLLKTAKVSVVQMRLAMSLEVEPHHLKFVADGKDLRSDQSLLENEVHVLGPAARRAGAVVQFGFQLQQGVLPGEVMRRKANTQRIEAQHLTLWRTPLLVLGGHDATGGDLAELLGRDPHADDWQALPSLPPAHAYVAFAQSEAQLFALEPSAVHVFEAFTTGAWRELAKSPRPMRRCSMAHCNALYIFGFFRVVAHRSWKCALFEGDTSCSTSTTSTTSSSSTSSTSTTCATSTTRTASTTSGAGAPSASGTTSTCSATSATRAAIPPPRGPCGPWEDP